jgi:hypothetical protein
LLRYRGAASRRCRRVHGRLGDDREEAIRTADWVKVGSAPNETSALLMEGVLNNAGIPVLIRRGAGFDVPDFLSAGPRDVLVPEPVAEEARQLLGDTTGLGSWAP